MLKKAKNCELPFGGLDVLLCAVFFFSREKKSSSRENFQFYTRENSILPVKNSLKLPVKDNVYP